jgi:predicted O-methyltransferase YrrM
MSFGERIVAGLKTIVLIEERTQTLDDMVKGLKAKVDVTLTDHEKRLTRLETIVEIVRPDGVVLRIAPRSDG